MGTLLKLQERVRTRQEALIEVHGDDRLVRWVPPPMPEDPREQKNIRTRLIILAVVVVLAQVISAIAR
jgi:hypothetical protein